MKNPATPQARGNDRPPTAQEIQFCRQVLVEEIGILAPRVIVPLGSPATRTLLQTKETITRLRGRPHRFPSGPSIDVFPIYHPAALCHNPGLKAQVLEDLKTLKSYVGARFQPAPVSGRVPRSDDRGNDPRQQPR